MSIVQLMDALNEATAQLQDLQAELTVLVRRAAQTVATIDAELQAALIRVHPLTCPKCTGIIDPLRWREEAEAKLRAEAAQESP